MKKGAVKLIDRIGDPMDEQTLYGPMHNQVGVDLFKSTIEKVRASGATVEWYNICNILHEINYSQSLNKNCYSIFLLILAEEMLSIARVFS